MQRPSSCTRLVGCHEHRVAKGEVGTIVLVAQDRKPLESLSTTSWSTSKSPVLSAMLDGVPPMNSLRLTNGLVIQCFPCTLRSMRGFSIPVAVMDELGFFRLRGRPRPMWRLRPRPTRHGGFHERYQLIKISTPYMRGGVPTTISLVASARTIPISSSGEPRHC